MDRVGGKTLITWKTSRLLPAPSIEYFVFNVINAWHQTAPLPIQPPSSSVLSLTFLMEQLVLMKIEERWVYAWWAHSPPMGTGWEIPSPPGFHPTRCRNSFRKRVVASILKDSTLCFLNNACKHLSCLPFRFSIGNRRKHLKIGFIRSVREWSITWRGNWANA